jgi:8-oxo-dGTP pyrophosphatase MutT (NUDIX family)
LRVAAVACQRNRKCECVTLQRDEPCAVALREVREETGFGAKIKDYAGSTHYLVGDLPKVVTYFLMEAEDEEAMGFRKGEEVEAVEWVTPEAGVAMLTYEEDRALIRAVRTCRTDQSRAVVSFRVLRPAT